MANLKTVPERFFGYTFSSKEQESRHNVKVFMECLEELEGNFFRRNNNIGSSDPFPPKLWQHSLGIYSSKVLYETFLQIEKDSPSEAIKLKMIKRYCNSKYDELNKKEKLNQSTLKESPRHPYTPYQKEYIAKILKNNPNYWEEMKKQPSPKLKMNLTIDSYHGKNKAPEREKIAIEKLSNIIQNNKYNHQSFDFLI
jgi:hypothetical protein